MASALRLILSVFIVFHLLVVALVANPDSVLNRQLEAVILPYANVFGLNTTWRFFSPNPMMQTIYYEALGFSDSGEVIYQVEDRFPNRDKDVTSAESMNRMMSAAMFLTARTDLIEQVLKPYLCGQHPKAQEIYIHKLHRSLPSIESAGLIGGDRETLTKTEKNVLATLHCQAQEPK